MTDDGATGDGRSLRIVHLLPDLLSVYGDSGNVRTLAIRAQRRGIHVEVTPYLADSERLPPGDLFVIGGGQDRDQLAVERVLDRMADALARELGDGASLLAVCAGYQSLGVEYRTAEGRVIRGPGILGVTTVGSAERLVGPVVARLDDPRFGDVRTTLVGFENHSGRTELLPGRRPLATVERGGGNDGHDGTEGVIEPPPPGGRGGLRIGTYLHGPVLPRNPHLADALLSAALARIGQSSELEALDDAIEWRAHDRYVERWRSGDPADRLPAGIRRRVRPIRSLIGF
jgi:lipid II isoglutaminyl synthase (glutamine-hydrolysing)